MSSLAMLAMLGSERELLFDSVFTVSCVVDAVVKVGSCVVDADAVRVSVEPRPTRLGLDCELVPRATRLGLEKEPVIVALGSVGGGRMLPIPPREYCEYCQY